MSMTFQSCTSLSRKWSFSCVSRVVKMGQVYLGSVEDGVKLEREGKKGLGERGMRMSREGTTNVKE
jgi:hypothetical protein